MDIHNYIAAKNIRKDIGLMQALSADKFKLFIGDNKEQDYTLFTDERRKRFQKFLADEIKLSEDKFKEL